MTLPQFASHFHDLSAKAGEIEERIQCAQMESRLADDVHRLAETVRKATAAMEQLVDELSRRVR